MGLDQSEKNVGINRTTFEERNSKKGQFRSISAVSGQDLYFRYRPDIKR